MMNINHGTSRSKSVLLFQSTKTVKVACKAPGIFVPYKANARLVIKNILYLEEVPYILI